MSSPSTNEHIQDGRLLSFEMDELPEFFRKKCEEELKETAENKRQKMQELTTMISGNQEMDGLNFEEDILVQYLRHSKYDVQKAFKQIKNYVPYRSKNEHLFKSVPDYYFLSKNSLQFIQPLPVRSSDGCTIVWIRLGKWDPTELEYDDFARLMIMTFIQLMRDPMTQINGFKIIHDFKDSTLGQYRYLTPQNLYFICYTCLDCIPARYKEIHFLNETFVMREVWKIIQNFMSEKIKSRVMFHSKVEDLLDYFPRSLLPLEYGGDLEIDSMIEWLRKANKDHERNTIIGQPNYY